jgi:EAL domain-containing protein (putative c-di-GMP-specific phosphodiesterase class I)
VGTFFEEFTHPYFQPVVWLDDSGQWQIEYNEVLLRFLAQTDQSSMHVHAISVAEEAGFMYDLDLTMLGAAIVSGRATGVAVGVNVSAVTIDRAYDQYIAELDRARTFMGRLTVELTETAMTDREHVAREFCRDVTSRGAKIALDDYGSPSGVFTEAEIRTLKPRYLKLDASRVASAESSDEARRWIRDTVRMASENGASVVAEGIESIQMAQMMVRLGCKYLQGYYIGRPMPHLRKQPLLPSPPERGGRIA